MIREAKGQDVPALVELVKALHASTGMTIPIDEDVTRRTLQTLIVRPSGLVLVAGERPNAFLAASIGYTSCFAASAAHEHGWYAAPEAKGAGLRLLILYERWAKEQGCGFIRMSTPPNNDRAAQILRKRGFFVSEIAMVKEI